ncbi:MAG: S8 family peptidase [Candidatus Limnocylindrales bacterium]
MTTRSHRGRRTVVSLLALSLALGGVGVAPAWAAEPPRTVEPARTQPPSADTTPGTADDTATPIGDEVLVRYKPGTTAIERAAIARVYGLSTVSAGRALPGGQTDVVVALGRSTATVRRQLSEEPNVAAVALNYRRELVDDISAEPAFADLWGLHNTGQRVEGTTGLADIDIDALQALQLGIGSPNVVVAVVDDGVDFSHPDLADRAWTNPGEAGAKSTNGIDDDGNGFIDDVNGWDFCNDDATVHDPGEDGHGTHVAGTIAASLNGTGVVGVAPGIKIMAVKFIDDSRFCGSDEMAIAAIDYAASFGVRIMNASWGGSEPSAVLDAAITDSRALFVAAAGNFALDLDAKPTLEEPDPPRFYPASSTLPNIVSVGAVDQTGKRADFSNFGTTSVDIAAPGTNILSTYPPVPGCQVPCYVFVAGTSMAAPHVAGVAALVGSSNAALLADPIRLRSRILATGQALKGGTAWTATGRLVNAYRAVDAVPPVVFAPNVFAVTKGSIVGPASVPVRVIWPAARDAVSTIARYDLRRKGPSGWSAVPIAPRATSAVTRLAYGAGYWFQLTAQDTPRNTGGPAGSPSILASLHGEGSSLARYSAGWRTVTDSTALGGKVRTTATPGAAMTFSFTGRSFALVASRGPSRGSIQVYVDGALKSTVPLYRASPQARVVVFSTSWTAKAAHRIRVVVVGSKRVDIDGFVVIR